MTALACVWVFRRTLFANVRNFVLRGLLPFTGGVFFLAVLVFALIEYARPDAGETTVFGIGGVAVIGVVSIVPGVPLMFAGPPGLPRLLRRPPPAARVRPRDGDSVVTPDHVG